MKRIFYFIAFLLEIIFFSYCNKEPVLLLSNSEFNIEEKGEIINISFTTNNDWSVNISNGSWLLPDKTSGTSNRSSFKVNVQPNDSFDERSATITITSGPLTKSIKISQSMKKGIIVTNKKYELTTEGGIIKVEVKSNIEYETLIPEEYKSWISTSSTKGLVSNIMDFNISANQTTDNRQGKIIFKEKNATVSDTVQVYQTQKDAIILTQRKYNVGDTTSIISVELRSNVPYLVSISIEAQGWISQIQSKALKADILFFNISANFSFQSRSAKIVICKSLTIISDTLMINQCGAPLFPTLTTKVVTGISPTTAQCGGTIISNGGAPITSRGVCWDITPNPIISGKKSKNGTGDGSFETEITDLLPYTRYYARAYATNRAGTSYGQEVSFSTTDTDQYPGTNYPAIKISNTIWAPVNAGYSSIYKYGLLYQWHRKYGQTYDESPAPTKTAGYVTLEDANKPGNSCIFYVSGDPITPIQQVWNMSSDYNPCPSGWEVPSTSDLITLQNEGATWTELGLDNLPGIWIGGNHNSDHKGSLFLSAAGSLSFFGNATERYSSGFYQSIKGSDEAIPGIFPANLDILNFYNNSYGANVFFICSSGKGNAYSIRCVKKEKEVPVLKTSKTTSITSNSATSGGSIEDSGEGQIIERGIVYSTKVHPTIIDSKVSVGGGGSSFSVNIKELSSKSRYYIRAYAINNKGVSYGQEEKFFTPSTLTEMPLYPGTTLKGVLIGSTIWAPVNAGYSTQYKFGLMYQWHRKYGQTYSESPLRDIVNGPVTLAEGNSVENKNKFFITNDFSNEYWCDTKPPVWDMAPLYNPCPEGWRVPKYEELEDLIYSGSTWTEQGGADNLPGRWFGGNLNGDHSGSLFLPASGYLTPIESDSHGRGFDSMYWSSNGTDYYADSQSGFSPVSAMICYFNPYSSSKSFMQRSYGISVRCVKEL